MAASALAATLFTVTIARKANFMGVSVMIEEQQVRHY
jgi:hypothetical protein